MDHLEVTAREIAREHQASLDVLRIAKNAFLWLALVAVALHLTGWLMVQFGGEASGLSGRGLGRDNGAAVVTLSGERSFVEKWAGSIESSLSVASFVGRASALIVASICVVALLVSLSARLGGAAELSKACVWSLVALALVTPWAGLQSAFYRVEELYQHANASDFGSQAIAFVRFGACPLLVAVCLVIAQIQFRRAYRRITRVRTGKLPIHEV